MKERGGEYFRRIEALWIPDNCEYDLMHQNINTYIDSIQSLSEELAETFGDERGEFFIKNLEMALSLLDTVHARRLANEGEKILRCVKNDRKWQVKLIVKPFINDLLALSIEMQRLQNLAEKEVKLEPVSAIEQHADRADNFSAVSDLIREGEYEQARNMIAGLEEYRAEAMLADLLYLVDSKKYEEAEKLANLLKEKHEGAIRTLAVSADGEQKIILAVDDRPEILAGIISALKERYKVFGVTNGGAALKFLQNKKPDLFILDIDMPGMNGYDLSTSIRRNENHASTPIIFLTGNSSRGHVMKAIQAGGNDFIVKPAAHDVLLTKIAKYLAYK